MPISDAGRTMVLRASGTRLARTETKCRPRGHRVCADRNEAETAAGSGVAHSLYSMWHSLLYGRLLYKFSRQGVTPKAEKQGPRGDKSERHVTPKAEKRRSRGDKSEQGVTPKAKKQRPRGDKSKRYVTPKAGK